MMDMLDADDEPLVSSRGQQMEADIVQFVPFNKFKRLHNSMLAREVLEEVPEQLTGWFERRGIKPNAAKPAMDTGKLRQSSGHGKGKFVWRRNGRRRCATSVP